MPYENNGGTCVGISGKDFAVVGADTRMSRGFSILSRDVPKIIKLTDVCCLSSSGAQADIQTLHKTLKMRLTRFRQDHGHEMSITAIAQMLSNTLYFRRFF